VASREVLVIGIGAGDPSYVTVQAVEALNRADVFVVLDKGEDKDDLVALRREILDRFVEGDEGTAYRVVERADPERRLGDATSASYAADVQSWHDQRIDLYQSLLRDEVADGEVAAFLAWGDPSLYDSTTRVLDQVAELGTLDLAIEVIPGISSLHALTARFAIPLNQIGGAITITTGRQLVAMEPAAIDNVVVLLDGRCSFAQVDPAGLTIWWGAYLGTPDEILVTGPLAEVAGHIQQVRAEARARKGWMFDTYLLRRQP
jgi:precorrin-6A synthase